MAKTGKYDVKTADLLIHPSTEEDFWEADWIIELKSTHEQIGRASFAGEKARGMVPFEIELKEEYRNKGYGTQAITAMVGWAFKRKNVYYVSAVTEHENDKYVHALENSGGVLKEYLKDKKELYMFSKPQTIWAGIYLVIGIFVGLALGIFLDHQGIGLALGIIGCLAIGASMDMQAKKEKERITGQKKS